MKPKQILVLGAGRSSSFLIDYLFQHANEHDWRITIGDSSEENIQRVLPSEGFGKGLKLDISNKDERQKAIQGKDLVISLLPPPLHPLIAKDCLNAGIHFISASYITDTFRRMHNKVKKKGLVFLKELGLDPGIDHMSAMKILDGLREKGAVIKAFRSYTGGLVAPESDDNPWHYKFSWNPANVVKAGQGTAKYIQNGKLKYIPYNRLFEQTTRVNTDSAGSFDAYLNRDSLAYIDQYKLQGIDTFSRGTLRVTGFTKSWNLVVKLGITDDTYTIPGSEHITYRQFTEMFLPAGPAPVETRLASLLGIDELGEEMLKLKWLGLLDDEVVGLEKASPARILQKLLEMKWKMKTEDIDWVVMVHEIEYSYQGLNFLAQSVLNVKGEDNIRTAMAKTVGLPLAIGARILLTGGISQNGLIAPLSSEIYNPVLGELEVHGIRFIETVKKI